MRFTRCGLPGAYSEFRVSCKARRHRGVRVCGQLLLWCYDRLPRSIDATRMRQRHQLRRARFALQGIPIEWNHGCEPALTSHEPAAVGDAPINGENRTARVGREVGRQEYDCCGDLVARRRTAARQVTEVLCPPLGIAELGQGARTVELLETLGCHRPRVDANH